MATNKFEAYTGGIYIEHHYFSFVSISVLCCLFQNSQSVSPISHSLRNTAVLPVYRGQNSEQERFAENSKSLVLQ